MIYRVFVKWQNGDVKQYEAKSFFKVLAEDKVNAKIFKEGLKREQHFKIIEKSW